MYTKQDMINAIRSLNHSENDESDPAFKFVVLSDTQMASVYKDGFCDSVFVYDITRSEGVLRAYLVKEVYEPRDIEKYAQMV